MSNVTIADWPAGTIAHVRADLGSGLRMEGTAVRTASGAALPWADEPVWWWVTQNGQTKADGGFSRDNVIVEVRPLRVSSDDVRRCRGCGCTDEQACAGGCWWVDPTLCSTCHAGQPADGGGS